ncbi:MAG TPA: hypothetical protein VG454_09245 [Gemmatimonadales bacterium]|nr:hypothetical protein [Gemmatimonadales bacterium]
MKGGQVSAVLMVLAFSSVSTQAAHGQSSQPSAVAAGRLTLSTNSAEAKAEFWQGLEQWQSGAYTNGERHFRRALALDSGFALARVYATGEAPSPAQVAERERAIADAARQSTEEGLLALFWREKANGQPAHSRALLAAAMQLMPNEPTIVAEYLWASLNAGGDAKQMLDTARAYRTRFPNYAPLAMPIPFFAMNAGDTAGALRAAEEYTRIAPRMPVAFGVYGGVLQQLGRFDEAEAQYRKGVALLPARADYGWDPVSALAEMYQLRGRTADARAVATEGLTRSTEASDSAMYMTEVAGTYFAAGDTRRGMQLLEQARQKSATMGSANAPEEIDAILAEADAVFGDGRSVGSYLARLRPPVTAIDSAVGLVDHGLIYGYAAGRLDSALAYSDRLASGTVPAWRGPWSHRIRGLALVTAKQCDRAKTELMQAPDTASLEVLTARAECEMQQGHKSVALGLRDRAKATQDMTFFRPALIRARMRLAQMK